MAAMGVWVCSPAMGDEPFFMGLGRLPGAAGSSAAAISADGSSVVGGSGGEAFRWTQTEGMVGLGDLPGGDEFSIAAAVSADGSVVVGRSQSAYSSPGEHFEAFRWTEATGMVGLGDLPGGDFNSWAAGVSADGTVVAGRGSIGGPGANRLRAFRWTAQTGMVDLGLMPGGSMWSLGTAVSADGLVVVGFGDSESASLREAFRWTATEGMVGLGDLPGGNFVSMAFGVSADGSVVVGNSWSGPEREAFRWTQSDGMIGLGFLPDLLEMSTASDASADGSVIVGYSGGRAFVWDAENGMRDLQDLLIALGLDLTGWSYLPQAAGVADDGLTIVGTGYHHGDVEAWIAHIPEPTTLAFLDIKPGSCPNPLNRNSRGVLPVAIVGTADFDVTQIDVTTLVLTRADGVGGSVAPLMGPPGPGIRVADVATPFDGEPCDCHELEADDIDDLSMRFDAADVVAALELNDSEPGATVELAVSGSLLDGAEFTATDCVRVGPAGSESGRRPARPDALGE